jgi:endoglucanase
MAKLDRLSAAGRLATALSLTCCGSSAGGSSAAPGPDASSSPDAASAPDAPSGSGEDAATGGLDGAPAHSKADASGGPDAAAEGGGSLSGTDASGLLPVPPDGAAVSPSVAPLAVPASGGSDAHLVTVGSSSRLELHGVAVWGIPDFVTTTFGASEYQNRDAVAATVASWNGNVIRLRVLADEYENPTYVDSQATYLQYVKDWVSVARAHGLYVQICWWDSLDSNNTAAPKNDVNWATQYAFAFPMMKDVHDALKLPDGSDDPAVFYEPFNEPNGVTWAQWTTAMEATVTQFRTALGYQGLLVLDTTTWSHDYSDAPMSQMETFDATLTQSGKANIAYARHDYCNDYGNVWSGAKWIANTGGTATAHVMFETEFGNYNGTGNQSDTWAAAATAYFKTDLFDRPNVAGAEAFLFGNWFDANAMSNDPAGAQPTTWGTDVTNWLSAY